MSIKFTTIPAKQLYQPILSTDSTFKLADITGFDGNALTSSDFGTVGYGVFLNPDRSVMELFSWDPTTIASTSITIVDRGLPFTGSGAGVTANKLDWPAGTTVLLGADTPQFIQWLKDYIDGIAIAGAPDASTTAKGIVEEATQAERDAGTAAGGTSARLFSNPSTERGKLINDYAADSVGTDSYAITTVPAITAYATGQRFTFKAGTANTGACTLAVCGLTAKTIKKNVSSDLATGDILANQIVEVEYDGANMQLLSVLSGLKDLSQMTGTLPVANGGTGGTMGIPFINQDVTYKTGTQTASAAGNGHLYRTSNADGSVYCSAEDLDNDGTITVTRYAKDALTGNYYRTHQTSFNAVTSGASRGCAIIGNYLYVSCVVSAANALRRFDLADLANITTITFSGTSAVGPSVWSDGTDLYISSAANTFYRYTISGTTATNAADITFTSCAGTSGSAISNGTYVWVADSSSGGAVVIRKYAIAGGAVVSSISLNIGYEGYLNGVMGVVTMGSSTHLAISWAFNWCSPTAVTGIGFHFMGITLP